MFLCFSQNPRKSCCLCWMELLEVLNPTLTAIGLCQADAFYNPFAGKQKLSKFFMECLWVSFVRPLLLEPLQQLADPKHTTSRLYFTSNHHII